MIVEFSQTDTIISAILSWNFLRWYDVSKVLRFLHVFTDKFSNFKYAIFSRNPSETRFYQMHFIGFAGRICILSTHEPTANQQFQSSVGLILLEKLNIFSVGGLIDFAAVKMNQKQ